jgi:DNA-binding protein HU-beta
VAFSRHYYKKNAFFPFFCHVALDLLLKLKYSQEYRLHLQILTNLQFSFKGVTVNKNELIAIVAEAAGITKADAAKAVDAFVSAITKSLKKGGEVRLVGFGTFYVANRKATQGRNPRTGKPIKIKASKQPKFRSGKALKEAVN